MDLLETGFLFSSTSNELSEMRMPSHDDDEVLLNISQLVIFSNKIIFISCTIVFNVPKVHENHLTCLN